VQEMIQIVLVSKWGIA